MSKHRNLMTVCLAAVFALGLAACSSSNDGPPAADVTDMTDMPTEPTAPMPPAPMPVEVANLMYLDEDNAPMAGTMMVAAGEMATNNGVIFMCPAGGDDCEVTVNADSSATSTGGAATATLSADAMLQVAQAKQDAQDEADRAALENRDRIIGKDRALEAVMVLPATGTLSALGVDEISISRGPSGPASVTSTGYSPHGDGALPNGDWAGTRLMQSVTGATNHLFVYTDIEAPTRIHFYNWDGDSTTPSLYPDEVTDALMEPAKSSTDITPLTLGDGGETFSAATADLTRFPEPQAPEEGDFTEDYPVNDASSSSADGTNNQVSIPGNYNGAGGRYICAPAAAGPACSVTVAPSGAYASDDAWTFVPELNSTAWRGDQEFMSFGWWLQEPTSPTGSYTFRYYADGDAYGSQDDATALVLANGSATYNGRAAGKFVIQEIDDTGVTGGEAGMFTAAASLTATFTGGTDNGAAGNIMGTINGFQSDNAGVDVSGWSVSLNRQTTSDLGSGGDVTSVGTNNVPTAGGFDGATAMMGDQTAYGTWTSQFFGQPTGNAYPLGVGGRFQADNEAASIAGAFGARR